MGINTYIPEVIHRPYGPIPARELLCHLRPIRSQPAGAILVLEAYFDDSGSHAGAKVSVWAGFIGSDEKWASLDTEWRALLKSPDFKLSHFHMYDVVHAVGECAGWERARSDYCIGEFRKLIIKHQMLGIGVSVPIQDWEEIAIPSKLLSYPVQQFALSACIPVARHHSMNMDDKMLFVFDDLQRSLPAVDSAINFYKNDGKTPEVAGVSFLDMKRFTGLQAADMLAWETHNYSLQYLEKGTYPEPTAHFKHLLDSGLLHGEFYDRERIKILVANASPMPIINTP